MRWIRVWGLAFAMALAGCAVSRAPVPSGEAVSVRLLAFNDFHGYLEPPSAGLSAPDPTDPERRVELPAGGVEYLSSLIQQQKAGQAHTAVVAAGDLVGASPLLSALFRDEPAVAALNALGLEFSAVGNHEFDHGRGALRHLQDGCSASQADCPDPTFAGARFQYLAANVIDTVTRRSLFPGYGIKQFEIGQGRKLGVAFIGVVLRGTPEIVTPSGIAGLQFVDEADAANALIPEIRALGVETIVLLIHEGGRTQGAYDDPSCPGLSGDILPILQRLDPAIRVVISGHTHAAYNCRVDGRVLTSAGAYGRVLTRLDLRLDAADGSLQAVSADNLPVVNDRAANPAPERYPALTADPALTAIVSRYAERAAPIANRVVGHLTTAVLRRPNPAGESPLGNLVADAQLAATREAGRGGAVIAMTNFGGLRNDLVSTRPDGAVTFAQAFAAQPFGNRLVTLTLTGAQIEALLEQQFPPAQSSPRILQVSAGFHYTYDPNAPEHNKVDPRSITLNGVPLDPAAPYRVTVNEFLARGGDGFSVLAQAPVERETGGDVEALADYLLVHSPVPPVPFGRIKRLQ